MSRIVGSLLGALVLSSGPPLPAQAAASQDDDLRVHRPAYPAAGPLVLFDAAHSNVHTSTGRYERFASLMQADGWVEDPDSTHHWAGCRGCLRFTRATGLLGDHPITQGRESTEQVRGVVSAVGQSLGSPPGAGVLLRLSRGALDIRAGGDTTSAAGRSQGVALAFGAGRVVVLGEAAMLAGMAAPRPDSRFRRWWSHEPGIHNRQFALNILHWLSGVLPMGSAPP